MPMNPRLLRPTPTGFNPSKLAALEFWLDASKTSTVTLNGSTVSEWRDVRSSVAYKVVQETAGSQPNWISSSKNGLPGVNFPAGRTLQMPASPAFVFSQPTTYFLAFQAPNPVGSWALFDGVTTRQHIFGTGVTALTMFAGSSAAAATITSAAFYAAILIYNGASSSHRLNTKTPTTVSVGANAINRLVLGSSTGTRADLNEFGMFSRALSAAEAEAMLDYLGRKWGIAVV
jgi:hypothetical protein